MQLPYCEVDRAFAKVAAVRSHMKARAVEGLQQTLDWRTLADIVADMYGLNIRIYEVTATGHIVAGNVERYSDGRAIIMVRSQQTEDMLRFVTVKEICHLMIDENDDWSSNAIETIGAMKIEFDLAENGGGGVANPSRTQMSEYLALIAAVALTYPCEFHAPDAQKISEGKTTIARIALEHGMPGWCVEMVFRHPSVFERYKDEAS